MTEHRLGLIAPTPEGRYVASCWCGKAFNETRRESVEAQHERHVHVEELREIVSGETGAGG